MNKYVLLVVACAVSSVVNAQRIKVGLKTGTNVSNGVGADAGKSNIRLSWHAGAIVKLNFTEHLSLQSEAQYSLKGDNSIVYGPSIMHHLAYLDVPVLAQYTLDDIFLEAGPRFSRLLSANPNKSGQTSIGKKAFNDQPYGVALGFGYQDESGLQVGWRYNADLSRLYRDIDFSGSIVQTHIRNSTMQFYLGALF